MPPECSWWHRHHLVASGEVESVRQHAHAHRCILRERNFIDRCIEKHAGLPSKVGELLIASEWFTVGLKIRPVRQLALEILEAAHQRRHHFTWRGTQCSRVAVGDGGGEEKLFACRGEDLLVCLVGGRIKRR